MQNQTTHHKGNKKKDKLGDKLGDKKEDQLGDKQGDKETKPREGGHTIQHRHTCGETMGDKRILGRQAGDKKEESWDPKEREGGHTIQHRDT